VASFKEQKQQIYGLLQLLTNFYQLITHFYFHFYITSCSTSSRKRNATNRQENIFKNEEQYAKKTVDDKYHSSDNLIVECI